MKHEKIKSLKALARWADVAIVATFLIAMLMSMSSCGSQKTLTGKQQVAKDQKIYRYNPKNFR